ncbi:DUF6508 domain-containing protein [Shewanella gelidii]|uniref:Uncharacterized protein n=1 Tax=Shewanella gelidii TaxID=1642821 RepID=A0A917JLV2_9GAMM|nr:DUF6508 domain-containing protein [Shewanella gelidii]MCL1099229.1 DUF6508 domain-containing protein [Shewanella gelidii]GGI76615.1 hypothetical protein GCM10009332_12470 [Shewanella gelidii]
MQTYLEQTRQLFLNQYIDEFRSGNNIVAQGRIQDFIEDVAQEGLLLTQFDWADWYQNSHLVDRPEYIASASRYECMLLLTAMTRLERFSPGVLDNMRRKGVLIAIIERLQTLNKQKPC